MIMPELATNDTTGYPRKRARTRRALINAGRAELAQHGPDGLTVGEIARRAHVSAGTFYNHFDDLDTLLRTVVDELAGAVELIRQQLAQREPDPADQIAIGTLQFLRLTRDDPATARAFVALLANVPEFRARVRASVGAPIADGVAQKRFAPRSPIVTTDAILGAVVQWMRTRLSGDQDDASDADHVSLALHIAGLASDEVIVVVDKALSAA
jgi:AcrR family transcriptional regulator